MGATWRPQISYDFPCRLVVLRIARENKSEEMTMEKRCALFGGNARKRNLTSICVRRIGVSAMSLAWVLMLAVAAHCTWPACPMISTAI
jgi:hypothetical protein